MLLCLFTDVACSVPEGDLMLSEDEGLEDTGQTSQLKTSASNGLLNFDRLVSHYSASTVV